jgi:hypothetical protein
MTEFETGDYNTTSYINYDDDDDDDNNNIPGNHEVKDLQKTAILGTAQIFQKVLTYRYNGVNAGNRDVSTMNS